MSAFTVEWLCEKRIKIRNKKWIIKNKEKMKKLRKEEKDKTESRFK